MKRVVLISLLSLSLLSACGESKDKKEFMRACLSNSGNDDICNCTYDRIAEKYGERWGSNDALQADPDFNQSAISSFIYCTER